jgi:acetoacetyl-CoA reductase
MSVKKAFVTGGVGGIGSAVCKTLAQNGHHVTAGFFAPAEQDHANDWLAEMNNQGLENVAIIGGDVSSFDSCLVMAQELGDIDILVNCAGITRDKTLKKLEPEHWNAVIQTNLNSLYNVSKQFVPAMAERGFGRVINISSVNGQKGQFGQTNYSAAKAGVHGFTMALAQEVARKGVTVNTIAPGYVETPMTAAMPDEILEQIVAMVPAGRVGQPEDIANAIEFLCSDKADYITGALLPVNGGMFMSF